MKDNSFVLTLRLDTDTSTEEILNKRFRIAEHIYNVMVKEARKRIHKLRSDRDYKTIMNSYRKTKNLSVADRRKLTDLRTAYGLTEYQFHAYLDKGQSQFKKNIDSFTRQKIGTAVWRSVESILFKKGKHIYYKKHNSLKSVEGKSNKTGIRFKNNKMIWNGLELPVIIKHNDVYAQETLMYHEVKYCRIVRRWHKHKYRYYVQLVMKGIPPQKHELDKNDSRKVGIDIGTSSIAAVSESGLIFEELAFSVNKIDKEVCLLHRKLDRQRRANNPENYNDDGTIRRQSKAFRRIWKTSNRQRQTTNELRTLYEKRADALKQAHEILANRILTLGTDVYVEDMNMQSLAKRAKETKISAKTGRYQKKKRFGKSIANHAPSLLIEILNRKLHYIDKNIMKADAYSIKASQFNHVSGEYKKSELSERWKSLDDKNKVQRDLYSAFLLMNCSDTKTLDISECFRTYDKFKDKHDKLIKELKDIKRAGRIFPACMGI